MAGTKNRSGGPRPGAGRPRKPPAVNRHIDPLQFLLDVVRGAIDPTTLQVKAAIAAVQYVHARKGVQGARDLRPAGSSGSRFETSPPPRRH